MGDACGFLTRKHWGWSPVLPYSPGPNTRPPISTRRANP